MSEKQIQHFWPPTSIVTLKTICGHHFTFIYLSFLLHFSLERLLIHRLLQSNIFDDYLLLQAMPGLTIFFFLISLKTQFFSCLPSVWICCVGVPGVLSLPTGGQTLDQSLSISQSPSVSWNLHMFVLLIIAAEPQTGYFVGFQQMLNKVSQRESGH